MPQKKTQYRQKRTCCCWRGSCKNLDTRTPTVSHKSFHTSTSKTWHLEGKIFPQGLVKRISPGSPQDLLSRTFTRSCKDLREEFSRISARPRFCENWTSHKSNSTREFAGKRRDPYLRACAIEMHMGISQEPSHKRIYKKNAGAQDRENPVTHIASERAQSDAHGHLTSAIVCKNLPGGGPEVSC